MYNTPATQTQKELDQEQYGDVLMEWTFPEFVKHQRNVGWYIWISAAGIILLAYSLWSSNYLFAILTILVGFILLNYHRHDPHTVIFQIRDKGLRVGRKFYPFSVLDNFWIIYEPPQVKNLYLQKKSRFSTELSIPLYETNPVEVRELLVDILPEDLTKESETTNDTLARVFKIQ